MNTIPIEKIFEEIGRLHVQLMTQQQYVAKLEAELARLQRLVPATTKVVEDS